MQSQVDSGVEKTSLRFVTRKIDSGRRFPVGCNDACED